jgi:hypothetical protein
MLSCINGSPNESIRTKRDRRSVKGSCPLARDPRGCRGRTRNIHFTPNRRFLEAAGSHRVLPSHSTWHPRRTPSEVPKRGEIGRTLYPLSHASQRARRHLPRRRPPSFHARGANWPALARQPACTGDNDDRIRRLRPGSSRQGSTHRAACWLSVAPPPGQRRTGPQVGGPVPLSNPNSELS